MLMIRLKFIQYYWCLGQKNEFVKCSFISLLKCMVKYFFYLKAKYPKLGQLTYLTVRLNLILAFV